MYKVDAARLFRDAAKSKRNVVGVMTGLLAALTLLAASTAMASEYEGPATAMFLVLLVMWFRSARRFVHAASHLAICEANLIKEQDLFEAQLPRKMEW